MSLTLTIPTLETERLILRAPRMSDADAFADFLATDRAKFVGGPVTDRRAALRTFGNAVGLWIMRGYSSFVATVKGSDDPIGFFGPWYPRPWPEPEFGWTLWSGENEGKGYVTEAMRTLIPWTWDNVDIETAISVIDDGNDASVHVAERLGATYDADASDIANTEGSPFYQEDRPALIYRHVKGGLK